MSELHPPSWAGQIMTTHECACADCRVWALRLARSRQKAGRALVGRGWVKHQGRWYCPECAERKGLRQVKGVSSE